MTDVTQSAPGGPPYSAARKLQVTQAASATWRTFWQRPWRFALLALIPLLVIVPVTLIPAVVRSRTGTPVTGLDQAIIAIVQYSVQFACQSACIHGAARVMAGSSFGIGEAIGVGFRRLLPVLGALILTVIAIVVGFILLVIPGVVAVVYLILATPACVVERRGPIDSIKRSVGLVSGNWWRTLGAMLLAGLVPLLGFVVVVGLIYALLASTKLPLLAFLLVIPAYPVFTAIGSILPSVLFVHLRTLKEGVSVRDVARVFD